MRKNLIRLFSHPQYRSLGLMFLLNSLLFTFWVTRVPEIKYRLDLSDGTLGLMLFFGPVGGLLAMLLSNALSHRWGEGRLTVYAMLAALAAAIAPVVAPTPFWLAASLLVMGFTGGTMNVAMNAALSLLEKRDQQRLMITCHGCWSLGGLIGATLTSFLLGAGVSPWLHWGVLVAVVLGWTWYEAWPKLSTIRLDGPLGPPLVLPTRPVLGLALIGLFVMICEGAAADWSGVYLAEVVGTSDYFVGFGYASFTLFMTLGRFSGDALTARLGSLRVIRLGTALALLGLMLVLIPWLGTTLLGFGLMGLGYSCVVPVLFSRSGQVTGLSPAMGIASVASAGYIGFLGGPVLIGLLAEHFGLTFGFVFLWLLTGLAFLFSPRALSWAR